MHSKGIDIYENISPSIMNKKPSKPILELNECLNGNKGKDIELLAINYVNLRKALISNAKSYTDKKSHDLLSDLQSRSKQYIVDVI